MGKNIPETPEHRLNQCTFVPRMKLITARHHAIAKKLHDAWFEATHPGDCMHTDGAGMPEPDDMTDRKLPRQLVPHADQHSNPGLTLVEKDKYALGKIRTNAARNSTQLSRITAPGWLGRRVAAFCGWQLRYNEIVSMEVLDKVGIGSDDAHALAKAASKECREWSCKVDAVKGNEPVNGIDMTGPKERKPTRAPAAAPGKKRTAKPSAKSLPASV